MPVCTWGVVDTHTSCTIVTFPRVVSRWVEVCSVIVFVYWCRFRGSLSSALNLSSLGLV